MYTVGVPFSKAVRECFYCGVGNHRRILDARENRSRASDKARVQDGAGGRKVRVFRFFLQ